MSRAQLTSTVEQNTGGAVAPFLAGKNKIINGDFSIWQRGTSFTITADAYTADRWVNQVNGTGTRTVSQQTFTAGTAPVAGYEGNYFLRMACTATGTASYFNCKQRIEDVRTFAGQTITISFWAKAGASLSSAFFGVTQTFGSGGSANLDTAGSNMTFTTSWTRYTQTLTLPSIAGKTIGAGSSLEVVVSFGGQTFASFDIWGVQLEAGSVATPFTTATGTLSGELAACQRYYWQTAWNTSGATTIMVSGIGISSTTVAQAYCAHPVTMRAIPSASLNGTSNLVFYNGVGGGTTYAISAITAQSSTTIAGTLNFTTSGTTTNVIYNLLALTGGYGYIAFSAEL